MPGNLILLRLRTLLLKLSLAEPTHRRRQALAEECRDLERAARNGSLAPYWLPKACRALEQGDVVRARRLLTMAERRLRKHLRG